MVTDAASRSFFVGRPDVVIDNTPQFFAAVSGLVRQRGLIAVPFVFEIRDLWPDSIVAMGVMKEGRAIRLDPA